MTKEEMKEQVRADNEKQVDEMNRNLEKERRTSNLEQLLNVLNTAIEHARTVDVMYDEIVRFAGAGYFNDIIRMTALLRQHQNNNMTNILVLERLKGEVQKEE